MASGPRWIRTGSNLGNGKGASSKQSVRAGLTGLAPAWEARANAPFALSPHFPYREAMQSQNPFLDEFAKLTTAAMGLAQAAGDEAKTAFRAQAEKLVADFDLVRRDELDALKAELQMLRDEVAALKAGSSDGNPARP